MTRIDNREQTRRIAAFRHDEQNKSLVEAANGLVQKILVTSDSNPNESCGTGSVVFNTDVTLGKTNASVLQTDLCSKIRFVATCANKQFCF